jgi:hypothetical protein
MCTSAAAEVETEDESVEERLDIGTEMAWL